MLRLDATNDGLRERMAEALSLAADCGLRAVALVQRGIEGPAVTYSDDGECVSPSVHQCRGSWVRHAVNNARYALRLREILNAREIG